MEVRKPSRPLRPGDTVALIRPGLSGPFPEWQSVVSKLEKTGLKVRFAGGSPWPEPVSPGSGPYYADDDTRARDFGIVLRDPEVASVMAFRGGSGAIRMLGKPIVPEGIGESVPLVCGFSDMTYLHAFLARSWNMVTFWGPNARELSGEGTFDLWWEAVSGGLKKGETLPLGECRSLRPGRAAGTLWGGNLESLSHLCGTPWFPDLSGRILFLEDIDEPLYAIDRSLRTLFLSGVFETVAGIVLGPFSRVGRREDDPSGTVFELLAPLTGDLPVIASSLPGHTVPMATWPLNVSVELISPESGDPALRLIESPFRNP